MVCSEVPFSYGLYCRETDRLICIGWCLYDKGDKLKDITERTLDKVLNNL